MIKKTLNNNCDIPLNKSHTPCFNGGEIVVIVMESECYSVDSCKNFLYERLFLKNGGHTSHFEWLSQQIE